MNKVNARLMTVPKSVPIAWLENGGLLLELVESPTVTRRLEEIIDPFSLSVESYLDIQVKRTKRAEQALLPYHADCAGPFDILLENGAVSLAFGGSLVGSDDDLTIRIVRPKEHWSIKIGEKKLNEYDFGFFDFSVASVEDTWDSPAWQDDDPLVYFPFADYGETVVKLIDNGVYALDEGSFYVEDFPHFISLWGAIKTVFCKEGWKIRSTLWESDWGRRVWLRALSDEFYKQKEGDKNPAAWGRGLNFKAELVPSIPTFTLPNWPSTSGTVPFNDDSSAGNYDYGGVFAAASIPLAAGHSEWLNPIPFTHEYNFGINLRVSNPTSAQITFLAKIELIDSTNAIHDFIEYELDIPANGQIALDRVWETIVYAGDRARVISSGGIIMGGSKFWGQVRGKHLYRGDQIDIAKTIPDDLLAIDALKLLAFLCNGKLREDYVNRTAWIDPPTDGSVYSGDLENKYEGHFGNGAIDLMAACHEDTIVAQFSEPRKKKLRLRFQSANDVAVSEAEEETLFSTLFEFKTGEEGEDELVCPLIEPTPNVWKKIEAKSGLAPHRKDLNPWNGLRLPSIRISEEGRTSGAGYRIVFAHGLVAQGASDLPRGPLNVYRWESTSKIGGAIKAHLPYAAQYPDAYIVSRDGRLRGNLVFGDTSGDLQAFWRQQILSSADRLSFSGLLNWDFLSAFEYRFDQRALLAYQGQTYHVEITELADIDFSADLPVPFKARTVSCRSHSQPCQCRVSSQLLYQPFNPNGPDNVSDKRLAGFEVDGVQYVGALIPLGFPDVDVVNGVDVIVNLINALNALGAPYFTFASAVNANTAPLDQGRWFRVTWPSCVKFTIVLTDSNPNNRLYLWTENGAWAWDDEVGAWADRAPLMPYHAPVGKTTTLPSDNCEFC